MKILVFGGNGFLGTSLVSLFKSEKLQSYSVSRSNKDSDYNIDIGNLEEFSNLPKNYFDIVVNCATVLPVGNYLDNDYLERIYRTNILGTQNICKWIEQQNKITKIINCSTLVVIGKPWPINLLETEEIYPSGHHVLYCSSKLTQELLFKTFATAKNITLLQIRFSALYGETMSKSGIIWNLIDQAKNNRKLILKNASKVSADFLHVNDAAKIILATIRSNISGVINGASGKEISILELAELIALNFQEKIEIENNNEENFAEDRAVINVDKLKQIIDISKFSNMGTTLQKMINL